MNRRPGSTLAALLMIASLCLANASCSNEEATQSSDPDASADAATDADPTPRDTDPTPTDADPAPNDANEPEVDAGAPEGTTCAGYATRYWDCCKAHCGWADNVPEGVSPATSCSADDQPLASSSVVSSCSAAQSDAAFTCTSMAPRALSDSLAIGFAAVPATGDICGRCYELTFDGTSYNAGNDPGSAALASKRMIVQATNIGHDVGGGQFDILIPGGGVGLFDACSYQWDVTTDEFGATYGGFLARCKETLGGQASHDALRSCVQSRCDAVFDAPHLGELHDGCTWFAGWFELADNPSLNYREVTCPQDLVDISGVDRRPLNDVAACSGPGSRGEACTDAAKAECDCDWTNESAACGEDDGSYCWSACCGE